MVLKTIVAATSPWVRIPRPPLRPRKTSSDLGLCPPVSRRRLVTDRSQMQPTAAICRWSRDIRGMDLEAFPQVNQRKRKGPAEKRDPCMVKAAPAAPLARRQRRALPWEARPAHAGPHPTKTPAGQLRSHGTSSARRHLPRPDCPARDYRLKAALLAIANAIGCADPDPHPTLGYGSCQKTTETRKPSSP